MSYCPNCSFNLKDPKQSTRWNHDFINHQEYFEEQVSDITKEQLYDMFGIMIKAIYFEE